MNIKFVIETSFSGVVEFKRELQPNEIIPREGDTLLFSREELEEECDITVATVVFAYGNEDKLEEIIVHCYIPEEDNK